MEGYTMADEATTTEAVVETSDDSTQAPATEAATTTEGEAALGDAGKKALDAMKAERNKFRDDLKAIRDEFDSFKAKAEGKEAEYQAEQQRRTIEAELLGKANERIVASELRFAAKGKVGDDVLPDLTKFINPSDFEVGEDGSVDADAIAQAVTDLITSRPSLAAQGKRFQGTADGGARNDASGPSQLTQADMDRMSPEEKNAAYEAGQFDNLLGRK